MKLQKKRNETSKTNKKNKDLKKTTKYRLSINQAQASCNQNLFILAAYAGHKHSEKTRLEYMMHMQSTCSVHEIEDQCTCPSHNHGSHVQSTCPAQAAAFLPVGRLRASVCH